MQKSAKLIDDEAYITAHERVSSAAGRYHMAFPPSLPYSKVGSVCGPYVVGGCKQKHVTSDVIDTYNSLSVPVSTRPNEKPSTELFGMPFKARGDGMLLHPEVLSKLQMSGFNPKCNKALSEVNYDRFDCINAPLVVEDEQQFGNPRGGEHTRVGPSYHLC